MHVEIIQRDLAKFGTTELVRVTPKNWRGHVDGSLESFQELARINRFGQVIGATDFETAFAIFPFGVAGQGDDGDRQPEESQLGGGLKAIHNGHLHVHEDDIVPTGLRSLYRNAAILGVGNPDSCIRKGTANEASVDRAVVDEKYVHGSSRYSGVVSRGQCPSL